MNLAFQMIKILFRPLKIITIKPN